MNRRGFFRGVLACAMTAAARVYAPSALSASKAQRGPFKVFTAPVGAPPFPPLRGRASQPVGYVWLPYIPHTSPR